VKHDLFGKPVSTFPDHALVVRKVSADDHKRRRSFYRTQFLHTGFARNLGDVFRSFWSGGGLQRFAGGGRCPPERKNIADPPKLPLPVCGVCTSMYAKMNTLDEGEGE
jgi:hypothetical protein